MADISNVDTPQIKDLYAALESLSCEFLCVITLAVILLTLTFPTARIRTRILY
jgi:hypothetical protein